jgi:hypothetical protein
MEAVDRLAGARTGTRFRGSGFIRERRACQQARRRREGEKRAEPAARFELWCVRAGKGLRAACADGLRGSQCPRRQCVRDALC